MLERGTSVNMSMQRARNDSPESAWEETCWIQQLEGEVGAGNQTSKDSAEGQDFNSQHSLLSMLLLELAWFSNKCADMHASGPHLVEFLRTAEWLGISRLR
eukprot:1898487-Amphidinium_carterae.1